LKLFRQQAFRHGNLRQQQRVDHPGSIAE
jgi:hypothetical protein